MEFLLLPRSGHLDHGLVTLAGDQIKRPKFDFGLDNGIGKITPDRAFGIVNGNFRIASNWILRRITDGMLGARAGKARKTGAIRGARPLTLHLRSGFPERVR